MRCKGGWRRKATGFRLRGTGRKGQIGYKSPFLSLSHAQSVSTFNTRLSIIYTMSIPILLTQSSVPQLYTLLRILHLIPFHHFFPSSIRNLLHRSFATNSNSPLFINGTLTTATGSVGGETTCVQQGIHIRFGERTREGSGRGEPVIVRLSVHASARKRKGRTKG